MTIIENFKLNTPDVVSETIDGETVIINLYQGLYYNLNPMGSSIWLLIEAGYSLTAIIELLQNHYSAWGDAETASVMQLSDRLVAEELVIASPQPSATQPTATSVALPPTFETPVLYKYADMQDLLALDPIHDVDETGWPNQPAEVIGAGNF